VPVLKHPLELLLAARYRTKFQQENEKDMTV
jgi:hypothetical protein